MNFARHKERWTPCEDCGIYMMPKVLYRGHLPCDILFIGEAPGESEAVFGVPFVKTAPAGSILEKVIHEVRAEIHREHDSAVQGFGILSNFPVGITNILACVPRDAERQIRPPSDEEAANCRERLEEIVGMASPKGIVYVGKVSSKHQIPGYESVSIVHPAAITRMPDYEAVQEFRKSVCSVLGLVRRVL